MTDHPSIQCNTSVRSKKENSTYTNNRFFLSYRMPVLTSRTDDLFPGRWRYTKNRITSTVDVVTPTLIPTSFVRFYAFVYQFSFPARLTRAHQSGAFWTSRGHKCLVFAPRYLLPYYNVESRKDTRIQADSRKNREIPPSALLGEFWPCCMWSCIYIRIAAWSCRTHRWFLIWHASRVPGCIFFNYTRRKLWAFFYFFDRPLLKP